MGMYTEILVKADVNWSDLNAATTRVLHYLFGDGDLPGTLPDHPFFTLERWSLIGHCSSCYHHPVAIRSIDTSGYGYIFSRSDLKNYSGEIEAFFEWFKPLTTAVPGQCIGYSWYEEDDTPTLIIK